MNRSKREIIDTRLLYWDPFRNSWFGKQLGDVNTERDEDNKLMTPNEYICKISKSIRWRFAHNKWDENKQEETTSIWYKDDYQWISGGDGENDRKLLDNEEYNMQVNNKENKRGRSPVHPDKWHQWGGPLHKLDKKRLYTMAFGGKMKWEMDEWGEKIPGSSDHYDWYPPQEVQWLGG